MINTLVQKCVEIFSIKFNYSLLLRIFLFTLASVPNLFHNQAQAFVNPVVTNGFMNSGLSAQFHSLFWGLFKSYKKACDNNEIEIGKCHVYETGYDFPKYIINFPTRICTRSKSKMLYIEKGLHDLANIIQKYDIEDIVIPALGCGKGGLKWNHVMKLINKELKHIHKNRKIILVPPFEFEIESDYNEFIHDQ